MLKTHTIILAEDRKYTLKIFRFLELGKDVGFDCILVRKNQLNSFHRAQALNIEGLSGCQSTPALFLTSIYSVIFMFRSFW